MWRLIYIPLPASGHSLQIKKSFANSMFIFRGTYVEQQPLHARGLGLWREASPLEAWLLPMKGKVNVRYPPAGPPGGRSW